jgi:hypothetical protein
MREFFYTVKADL